MAPTFTLTAGSHSPPPLADIGLLQEVARRDAELHLAYAAHLLASGESAASAAEQWSSGCIRLEAYVEVWLAVPSLMGTRCSAVPSRLTAC